MSRIILLNGCSSSGKSTIAKAIQHISNEDWIKIGIDDFIRLMPIQYQPYGEKAQQGFDFITTSNEFGPKIEITNGDFGHKFFYTAIETTKIFADKGFNLIIDEVLLEEEDLVHYIKTLEGHEVLIIQIFCDLKTLIEREFLRGNRTLGLANGQFDIINKNKLYDLKIDSTNSSSFKLAEEILEFIDKNKCKSYI